MADNMKVIHISAKWPDPKVIKHAAGIIRRGGLVIFPTETVYGLGADAFNAQAVRKIFKVKGRPEKKPLIVHVSKKSAIDVLARDVPSAARKLVRKFWPGPLTLVLTRRTVKRTVLKGQKGLSFLPDVSDVVTGGGDTVAIRMPDHPVALALIRAAGPLAASSANFSGDPPPRSIKEIPKALLEKVDLVLDAGRTTVGVPSTVVDLTKNVPGILRLGAISGGQLKQTGVVIGEEKE